MSCFIRKKSSWIINLSKSLEIRSWLLREAAPSFYKNKKKYRVVTDGESANHLKQSNENARTYIHSFWSNFTFRQTTVETDVYDNWKLSVPLLLKRYANKQQSYSSIGVGFPAICLNCVTVLAFVYLIKCR